MSFGFVLINRNLNIITNSGVKFCLIFSIYLTRVLNKYFMKKMG